MRDMAMNNMEQRVGVGLIGLAVAAGMTGGCSSEQPPAEAPVTPYVFQSSDFEQHTPINGVAPVEVAGGHEQWLAARAGKKIITAFGCLATREGAITDHTRNDIKKIVIINDTEYEVTGKVDSNARQLTAGITNKKTGEELETVLSARVKETSYGDGYEKLKLTALIQDVKDEDNVETPFRVTVMSDAIDARFEATQGKGDQAPRQWRVVNPRTEFPLETMNNTEAGDYIDDRARKLGDVIGCDTTK